MSGVCKNCGSNETEDDPSRGDVVCQGCGLVFEDQRVVSSTQFEETSSGSTRVPSHFVGSDSTGGGAKFANNRYGGRASREITLSNARKGIQNLCNQLHLRNSYFEVALNFYSLALNQNLTRGRRQALNHAACVYMTCRTEETEHLLIDISDVLQIDVYELGRTYLQFTKALCISPPSVDPCIYIMRFASELEFGDKKRDVCKTATRVLKRMKKDSIHSGRRPSGLCGAALLIAARLHDFNRTPADIVKIVQVHESTLRKRLMEFGDTPSSTLTLEEFQTIDLEAEQDPPAFKARKKDLERLQNLNIDNSEFDELQKEIEKQLEHNVQRNGKRKRKNTVSAEEVDTHRFIEESTMNIINNCLTNESDNPDDPNENIEPRGLGPDISTMGLSSSLYETSSIDKTVNRYECPNGELDMTGLDDDELDDYILTDKDTDTKINIWNTVNATYLEQMKEKEAQRLKDIEDGKPEKKKRKTGTRNKNKKPANSAGEAIEKMLQEKRISSKINYDVIKDLNTKTPTNDTQQQNSDQRSILGDIITPNINTNKSTTNLSITPKSPRKNHPKIEIKLSPKKSEFNIGNINDSFVVDEEAEVEDDEYAEEEPEDDLDPISRAMNRRIKDYEEDDEYDEYY